MAEREYPLLSPPEVNRHIRAALGRKLVVVGACVGTDAHTVGIDAILNVKGHAGEKGLEYYREIRVVNLGAQVEVPRLVATAAAEGADAVLVSQVVTQRDAHLANARELARAFASFSAADPGRRRPLLVIGGPRFDPAPGVRGWAWTRSSARAPRPARWRATWLMLSPGPRRRRVAARAGLSVAHRRYVSYSPRALRREPGRRRLRARPVRRRGDRAVHPVRRRRGAVRVVLRRAVPGPGPGRGRYRGDRDDHPRGHPEPGRRVRGPCPVPGGPGTRSFGRPGPGRAHRRGDRDGHRGRAPGCSWPVPAVTATAGQCPAAAQRPWDRVDRCGQRPGSARPQRPQAALAARPPQTTTEVPASSSNQWPPSAR